MNDQALAVNNLMDQLLDAEAALAAALPAELAAIGEVEARLDAQEQAAIAAAMVETAPAQPCHVWTSRSQPRDPETGEIAFDISFNVGSDDESWSRVPITALMDLDDRSFEHEEVTDAINDWLLVAKQYPFIRRNCLCCQRRAIQGKVLCGPCGPKYGPTIEDEEEDEVKEEVGMNALLAARVQGGGDGVWFDAPRKLRTGKAAKK